MRLSRKVISLLLLLPFLSANAQILYKVEGKGLKAPSYIFGTHHVAPLSTIDKFGAMEPFKEATQVIGEIDMTQDQMTMGLAMQKHMLAPSDSTLSKVISPEDFAIIGEEFKKWAPAPGMELQMLDQFKPMAVSTMVAMGMAMEAMPDFNATEQLDTYFQLQGKQLAKTIMPLETVEQQATILFDTTPISYQAEALVEVLKDPAKAIQSTKDLTEAYFAGDLDKMMKISEEDDEHPEFMKALLDNRNADWLTKLPAMMEQNPSFIAVGALHLAGDKGIVEGLRKLGYTVTPVAK